MWDERQPISVHDVAQGYTLGNCYLVAAMSALAQNPQLIKNIFNFQEGDEGKLNPNGIISINMFIAGVPHVMNIDDIFPVTNS